MRPLAAAAVGCIAIVASVGLVAATFEAAPAPTASSVAGPAGQPEDPSKAAVGQTLSKQPAARAPGKGPAAQVPATAHVVAVGDIARAGGRDDEVADLVDRLAPGRLLLAGDIAYPKGATADFAQHFDPDWSRFRSIWLPVPGNHEYQTSKAAGYRKYFEDSGALYWARPVSGWVVIGLDSERVQSKKQQRWLRRTLAKYQGVPTLVTWHRPRYSRGHHDDQRDTAPLYRIVRKDPDVRLLVWGHDHNYERMAIPVPGRTGSLPAFVAGTGGAELRCDATNSGRTWSEVFNCKQLGVLSLRLGQRRFDWAFVALDGRTLDAGSSRW